eukprot:2131082-Prymnesium_polylepis.1
MSFRLAENGVRWTGHGLSPTATPPRARSRECLWSARPRPHLAAGARSGGRTTTDIQLASVWQVQCGMCRGAVHAVLAWAHCECGMEWEVSWLLQIHSTARRMEVGSEAAPARRTHAAAACAHGRRARTYAPRATRVGN